MSVSLCGDTTQNGQFLYAVIYIGCSYSISCEEGRWLCSSASVWGFGHLAYASCGFFLFRGQHRQLHYVRATVCCWHHCICSALQTDLILLFWCTIVTAPWMTLSGRGGGLAAQLFLVASVQASPLIPATAHPWINGCLFPRTAVLPGTDGKTLPGAPTTSMDMDQECVCLYVVLRHMCALACWDVFVCACVCKL